MRLLLVAFAALLIFAAVALAYPPATITEVTQTSLKVGNLDPCTQYRIQVAERRSGQWRDNQTYTRTTACAPPPPPDADGDGVPDSSDACPNQHGQGQPNGCPPPPPPPPSGEPSPIAGQGYTLRLDDQFDTLNRAVWDDNIWYGGSPPANSQYVQDGVLNLVSRRSQGFPDVTATTQTAGLRYQQGYFEARMRWTKGNGSWPAFWLLSYAHATNPSWPSPACPNPNCLSAELDVFEGQGREPNIFYGTLHRNSCNCYGVPNSQTSPNTTNVGLDQTAGFHTYAAKWDAQRVTWYLDGAQLHSAPVYDSFNQPMFLLLQMWIGGWTGGTDSSTPDELRTEVDWVRVWQQ